jgi:hypothetical protein
LSAQRVFFFKSLSGFLLQPLAPCPEEERECLCVTAQAVDQVVDGALGVVVVVLVFSEQAESREEQHSARTTQKTLSGKNGSWQRLVRSKKMSADDEDDDDVSDGSGDVDPCPAACTGTEVDTRC